MVTAASRFTFKDDNTKFGKEIYYLSVDREFTCLGASDVCRQVCYGGCNRFIWNTTVQCYLRCYENSLSPRFARDVIASLAGRRPMAFRIHDVGDFYSAPYVRKWMKIVRARRDIKFFAYTRTWTRPALVQELARLAAEPNMALFLSLDHSMLGDPIPPELAHLPRAWLAVDDDDIPPRQLKVDVVFRNLRNGLQPLQDLDRFGAMLCQAETGWAKRTCRECMFCPSGCKRRQRGDAAAACNLVAIQVATAGGGVSG